MGCASSKPSKNKKDSSSNKKLNKKSKSNDAQQASKPDEASQSNNQINNKEDSDSPIHLDKNLIDQIKKNEVQVIEYIVKIVHKELNNELTKHATARNAANQSPNFASTALAAKNQQENDDLIIDVSSKAINTIVNTSLPNTTLTYKSLNLALRSWPFICKNQANKTRICDLTTETISQCLHAIDEEIKENSNFDLVSFLAQNSQLTPPTTPEKEHSQEEIWNRDAILLNRTKANQIARLLFLSNKARPVIHTSNRIKDAYFVNRELPDKTQITITEREIDEILNNSTYKNNPHITPITQRKLDFNSSDLAPRIEASLANTLVQTVEETTVVVEERKVENNITNTTTEAVAADLDATCVTVDDLTWANLSDPSDFEKVTVKDLTKDNEEEKPKESEVVEVDLVEKEETIQITSEQSADTNVVDPSSSAPVPDNNNNNDNNENNTNNQASEYLTTVVNEINDLQETSTSEDTEKIIEEPSTSVVTPPSTPTTDGNVDVNGLVDLVEEIANHTVETEPEKQGEEENVEVTNDSQNSKDEGNMDPVLKQELLDDRFYNDHTFKNGPPVNGDDTENEAATKIQATFKGEEVRKGQNEELNNGAN